MSYCDYLTMIKVDSDWCCLLTKYLTSALPKVKNMKNRYEYKRKCIAG